MAQVRILVRPLFLPALPDFFLSNSIAKAVLSFFSLFLLSMLESMCQ